MVKVQDVVHALVKYLGMTDEEALVCAVEISDKLQTYYEISPGSSVNEYLGKLSNLLEDMQRRVMRGEDLSEEIELTAEELCDVSVLRNLAFEDNLRLDRLNRKLEYIKSWNMVRKYGERLREKESELRRMVCDEAWTLYLDIEEIQREFCITLAEQVVRCK
jgi:hypothetical protein